MFIKKNIMLLDRPLDFDSLGSAVVLPQILRLIRENDMIIMIPLRRP
jgi:hypothetical protein